MPPERGRRRWIGLTLAVLLACGSAGVPAAELTVSAASSLSDAFQAVLPAFEARHPGSRVRLNLGASGVLVRQIEQGAPVDVLASADPESLDQAARLGLLRADTRAVFASNRLVLAQARSAVALRDLAQLQDPQVRRIALGQPTLVPAGRYARTALQAAGLWEALQPRYIYTQNVRQALDYLVRGEVDAAFLYASDLHARPAEVVAAFDVPDTGAIRYPVAVTARSRQPEAAAAFVAFLLDPEAQALLQQHGFRAP
jgi:molybdate transport system substrate-binding protein